MPSHILTASWLTLLPAPVNSTGRFSFLPVFVCVLRKPKTKRSKRFLESRAPKLVEDVKMAMIMKGGNTSQTITQALKDIVSDLVVPSVKRLSRHNYFMQMYELK